MTQSMDYTGTVKTKRCKNTGMTEEIIRKLHGQPGARVMAIVELCVDDAHNKHDAPNHVDFTIEQLVPFVSGRDEAHLRSLTASAHQHRVLNSDDAQLAIDTQEDLEPSVDKIIAAREASEAADKPHAFIDDGAGDCDICDGPKANPIHAEVEDVPDDADDADDPADDPAEDPAEDPVPVG